MIRNSRFAKGGVIAKLVIGFGIIALGFALLVGYILWSAKHSIVNDSAGVIDLFQEIVPGAEPPPGYQGLAGTDYRGTGRRDDEVRAYICKVQGNPEPESDHPRLRADPTHRFKALSVPNDNNLDSSVWDAKLREEFLENREELESEPIILEVGGQQTEFQRIVSKDLDGNEFLEYKLAFQKDRRWNFLVLAAPIEIFDESLVMSFLESVEPIP